ncbi:MAG: diguanylate cyclase [Phascolarctobacterium sp.]|nr:MAG: diguanylate cyclase [Phascolarctobacterium sp.]
MFNKIWNAWNDIKAPLGTVACLTLILAWYDWWWLLVGAAAMGGLYWYYRRSLYNKEIQFNSYLDTIVRNIERTSHNAVQNLDVAMAVFGQDGKLQWKNELFAEYAGYAGVKNVDGKRPEEIFDLPENAFDALSIKDGERLLLINGRYYRLRHCRVLTGDNSKKDSSKGYSLIFYLNDVTDFELLRQKYANEKLCLAYVRFDNYEDVTKGMGESTRANISGEVNEVLSKWAEEENGFILANNKESFLIGINQASLQDLMEKKFPVLDKIHEIQVGNKITPTISVGIACDGRSLEEVSLNAAKALDLALGRGGDQVVVAIGGNLQFFGGISTVTAKSTRVRARIVAHTVHEQMLSAEKIFVMGHTMEDFDAIGSAIGMAKMARSLNKETYIVVSGQNQSVRKIAEALRSNDMKLMDEDDVYADIMVEEEEALKHITPKSLLILVDHHRKMLCASQKVLEAIPWRIIIDHHRRAEDAIKNTTLQYMEPSSSSTSELVTELVGYFNDRLEFTKGEATALYAGIVVDTKNFAVQTGERTFEAAALLRRSGADPNMVRQLFKDDLESVQIKSRLIAEAEMVEKCMAISVYHNAPKEVKSSIIAAQAADSMININGISVSVVITEYKEDNSIGVSARSDGSVNVQIIMEELGGGGHQTVAGVQLKDISVEEVKKQIIALTKKQLEEDNNESDSVAGH